MCITMEQFMKAFFNNGISMFLAAILLFLVTVWYLFEQKGLPPGPRGLPIVGYLPFMSKKPHETLAKLASKYGPIFRIYIGNKLVVVLNNYTCIKEAFVKQAETFSGRPQLFLSIIPHEYNKAIVTTDGEYWKDHRRFAITLLRDCGVGKMSIEPRIMEEINFFLSKVKAFNGKPADIKNLLSTSIANNICIMAFGKRFHYEDAAFLKIQDHINKFSSLTDTVSLPDFFPWIKYIPGVLRLTNQSKLMSMTDDLNVFLRDISDEQMQRYNAGDRDHYVSAYKTEQQSRVKKNISIKDFDELSMMNNIRVIMSAGTETTSSTILWGILYMLHYPEVQKKVRKEIDAVIGADRTPSWNDKLRMPYTEATLCEIQRKADLVPINLPHRNIKDCEVLGYKIPKNSYIISNLGQVLNDPALWGDPENFRPERFLSKTGEVQKPEYLIPFSIGKRECLGETLARMELFLYFTSMLQHFTFETTGNVKPSLVGNYGFTNSPKNFLTCAIPRRE